ncbi:unnamed protein product, partial [Didymodactylos carnosus]
TVALDFNFDLTYNQLQSLCEENCAFFAQNKNDVNRSFERLFIQILHSLEIAVPIIRYITENFHYFDYSEEIKANGYRSLVVSHGQCSLRCLDIVRQLTEKRQGLLFSLMYSSRYLQDLEAWTKCLISLQNILQFAAKMIDYSGKKVLLV